MCKVSIESYKIPNIKYDLLSLDEDLDIKMEAKVRARVSEKNKNDNKIQIDLTSYTDKDNPFISLSIIGVFSVSDEMTEEDMDEVRNALSKEGIPMLYEKLKECHSQMIKIANISYPQLPEFEFDN